MFLTLTELFLFLYTTPDLFTVYKVKTHCCN